MKNVWKGGVMALLAAGMLGMTSCSDDDPDYSNVTPPSVAVNNSISGRVTSISGSAISGAVITLSSGSQQTTGADGTFVFDGVSAGTYTLNAVAAGKVSKSGTVTVTSGSYGDNVVYNVVMSNEGTNVTVNADGSAEGSVTSETITGNERGEVDMTVTATAGAIAGSGAIVVTPIYYLEEAAAQRAAARAESATLLIGANLSAADASVALNEPVALAFDVDEEIISGVTARKYENGQWVEVPFTAENGKVTVEADELTSYTLMVNAEVTSSTSTESISLGQSSWDNLYGNADMAVGNTTYTYRIGTSISTGTTDRVTAYLTEILARTAGTSLTTATGTYPLNVTLPIGTALNLSASQQVTHLTATGMGKSASCTQYGDVRVTAQTYNRQHTGGSN